MTNRPTRRGRWATAPAEDFHVLIDKCVKREKGTLDAKLSLVSYADIFTFCFTLQGSSGDEGHLRRTSGESHWVTEMVKTVLIEKLQPYDNSLV